MIRIDDVFIHKYSQLVTRQKEYLRWIGKVRRRVYLSINHGGAMNRGINDDDDDVARRISGD